MNPGKQFATCIGLKAHMCNVIVTFHVNIITTIYSTIATNKRKKSIIKHVYNSIIL